jgi:site-specific DNA recombinase
MLAARRAGTGAGSWLNKRWQTRKGHTTGGQSFTRTSLYRLLTNVAYVGKVRYKDEVHDGEHSGIVDPADFQRVQTLLRRNGQTRGAPVRNKFGALLKGIIRCVPCDCAMTPSHTTGNRSAWSKNCCERSAHPIYPNCFPESP